MLRPKAVVCNDNACGKVISHIQFGTFSSTEVARLSELINRDLNSWCQPR